MTSASESGLVPGDERRDGQDGQNGRHASGAAAAAGEGELSLPIVGEVERLVRAHGTLFIVTDRQGDIAPAGARELGLFHDDTRHLSHFALRIPTGQLVRLSAETSHQAYNQIDLMLSELASSECLDDPRNFFHIRRRQLLDAGLVEEVVFTNFLHRTVVLEPSFCFGADFADIFEVRGAKRARRGRYLPARIEGNSVTLAYEGLCGDVYETVVAFTVPPAELADGRATFELSIAPDAEARFEVRITPRRSGVARAAPAAPFGKRAEHLTQAAEAFRATSTQWTCNDGLLQEVLDQSVADLSALRIHVGDHSIVGAGIPWFCAPFGRDALITAYEALLLNPDLAVEALRALAAYQGKTYDDVSEEEPGKILHELRFGEMARCREIPHTPYYGSIDATPLFVVVADAVHLIAGDDSLLRELEPALSAALGWIDTRSKEGTSLVTYQRKTEGGLENQGWKDSRAGVPFPDGRHAEPPIALCEVQGYCIDAYTRAVRIYHTLGKEEQAKTYAARAAAMRETLERKMWFKEASRYAYAIDGRDRALPTIVSNMGHLLWSGAMPKDHAAPTARMLLASNMFSGFGIRTLAEGQPAYNPLSYHNGTVWPHDNALIAKGLADYGLYEEALKVFEGMRRAMAYFVDRRPPELFCGIGRRKGPLVRYPVAGSPQAWAAAAPFLFLQSILGIRADAPAGRLCIRNPRLPSSLRTVELHGMRVGSSMVSVRFRRVGGRCHVDRLEVTGAPLKTQIEID